MPLSNSCVEETVENERLLSEGYLFEPTTKNQELWKAWWKEVRNEQFFTFLLIGCFILMLMLLSDIKLVLGSDVGSGMALLLQEKNSITSFSNMLSTVFILMVVSAFFTPEIGVLDHVCSLTSDIFRRKGFTDPNSLWKCEGAFYQYTLWLMIACGINILLELDISQPPRLLVIAGSFSWLAMFVYTLAIIVMYSGASKKRNTRFKTENGKQFNLFKLESWRHIALFLACAMFGGLILFYLLGSN